MKRGRIAWFSSHEEGSLSRMFTESVLPRIGKNFEVELFQDGFQSESAHHYLSAFSRNEEDPFDLFVYNLEDQTSAGFSRFHAGLKPGVCIFHDILFTTRAPESLAHSPWEFMIERFKDHSHPWPQENMWPERNVPFAYREAALAFVAVFTSEWAHGEYRRSCGEYLARLPEEDRSYYLPFPIPVTASSPRQEKRTLSIAYAGSTRIESRAHKLLHALSLSQRQYELLWMLSSEELADARRLCEEFGVKQVKFIQGRSASNWQEVLQEADVVFHLKFSLYGNDSPWLPLSLMQERGVVITDFGSAQYLSDSLVFKVKPGEAEVSQILALLQTIPLSFRNEEARSWALQNHQEDQVGLELGKILDRSISALKPLNKRWQEMEGEARREVLETLKARLSIHGEALEELGWFE